MSKEFVFIWTLNYQNPFTLEYKEVSVNFYKDADVFFAESTDLIGLEFKDRDINKLKARVSEYVQILNKVN